MVSERRHKDANASRTSFKEGSMVSITFQQLSIFIRTVISTDGVEKEGGVAFSP